MAASGGALLLEKESLVMRAGSYTLRGRKALSLDVSPSSSLQLVLQSNHYS